MSADLLLLLNATVTWTLVGLIWTVQVVHYPLFDRVERIGFPRFERDHSRRIGWIVGPLMAIEAMAALALAVSPPPGVPRPGAIAALLLVVAIWLSTVLVQVPQHRILGRSFDAQAHRRLTHTNWIRTGAWTVRGGIVLWMLAQAMR